MEYSRNTLNQKKEISSSSVNDEVQKLFKKNNGKIDQQDFEKLRNKYGNEDLVNKIQKVYVEKHAELSKRAKKFAILIREKYSNSQYPFHILLEKAIKYKNKYNISDDEFVEFQRIYENELVGLKSTDIYVPNTNIMKTLGNINLNVSGFTSKLSDADYKVLQDIIKLHATSKPLHSQVFLQSIQYKSFGIEALTGKYDRVKHDVNNHVHPVIAALFLPKFKLVDSHFLHSNISNIVRTRFNNESFTSIADLNLFYSLIKDPNDIVCDSKSTLVDLYNRSLLQNQLWNAVLRLRNGQYYDSTFREFITSVDICRLNKHDTPDLIYGRYDGTIIKRLLAAFSFRPTVVSTLPIYQTISINPYQQNVTPTVSYVPMINLKLGPNNQSSEPVLLYDAIQQEQYFIEHGFIQKKNTSLIYSKEILIFFVDRRANIIDTTLTMNPIAMLNFPSATIAGFERLNDTEVVAENVIQIRNDIYELVSVVISEVNKNVDQTNLIVGSSTLFIKSTENELKNYIQYDPYGVVDNLVVNGVVERNDPIMDIPFVRSAGEDDHEYNFIEMSRKRGIIFIYQLKEDNTKGKIIG